jgi:DNA polymerase III alpha subunit
LKTLKNELNDRVLRFDGVSEVDPEQVARFLLLGVPSSKLRIHGASEDIESFNRQVPEEDQVLPAIDEPVAIDLGWQIPEPYLSLDLDTYLLAKFDDNRPQDYTDAQYATALQRIADELEQIEQRGMVEFMRTIIYVLDTLRKNNVVWGVGRGSSCACYLLFIVGLHAVDCVRFEVPMEEFFHE